jgi:hypothetical protein
VGPPQVGLRERWAGNLATDWGAAREAAALGRYEQITGQAVVGCRFHVLRPDDVHGWLGASPDGLISGLGVAAGEGESCVCESVQGFGASSRLSTQSSAWTRSTRSQLAQGPEPGLALFPCCLHLVRRAPRVLFCVPNTTDCILLVSVLTEPNALDGQTARDARCFAATAPTLSPGPAPAFWRSSAPGTKAVR